jgi:hypothetical protein
MTFYDYTKVVQVQDLLLKRSHEIRAVVALTCAVVLIARFFFV